MAGAALDRGVPNASAFALPNLLTATRLFFTNSLVFRADVDNRHGNGVDRSLFQCDPPVEVEIDYGGSNLAFDDIFSVHHMGAENVFIVRPTVTQVFQATLGLYDSSGRLITSASNHVGQASYTLNTTNLPTGIYVIAARLKNGTRVAKKIHVR